MRSWLKILFVTLFVISSGSFVTVAQTQENSGMPQPPVSLEGFTVRVTRCALDLPQLKEIFYLKNEEPGWVTFYDLPEDIRNYLSENYRADQETQIFHILVSTETKNSFVQLYVKPTDRMPYTRYWVMHNGNTWEELDSGASWKDAFHDVFTAEEREARTDPSCSVSEIINNN